MGSAGRGTLAPMDEDLHLEEDEKASAEGYFVGNPLPQEDHWETGYQASLTTLRVVRRVATAVVIAMWPRS